MKTIFKIPVLLLALILVISCGKDSKKEEEKKMSPVEMATKVAELECESELARIDGDSEKAEKIDEEASNMIGELRKILGDDPDEEIEASIAEAFREVEDQCSEKITEMAAADGKKAGELYCKVVNAIANSDYEDLEKLTKESQDFSVEMEKKYLGLEANEEVKKAFNDAMMAANENCI